MTWCVGGTLKKHMVRAKQRNTWISGVSVTLRGNGSTIRCRHFQTSAWFLLMVILWLPWFPSFENVEVEDQRNSGNVTLPVRAQEDPDGAESDGTVFYSVLVSLEAPNETSVQARSAYSCF